MDFDIEKIKELFIEEAEELFEKIDSILLAAEKAGTLADDKINSLFRYYHTIKGNTGTIELFGSSVFTHKLESFLDRLKKEKPSDWSQTLTLLIEASDTVKKTIEAELAGQTDQSLIEPIYRKILFEIENWSPEFSKQKQPENNAPAENQNQKESKRERTSIKVELPKIDALMNSIGEIVITVSMLNRVLESIEDERKKQEIRERMEVLSRQLKEMQDSAMSIRMVQIKQLYAKFPKQIRDVSKQLGKKVELVQIGEDVEIDKGITDGLEGAFTHIIRNSLDHGIESPAERVAAGKNETAVITMEAKGENGQIVIKITDDGKGIDPIKIAKKAVEKGIITEAVAATMTDNEKIELIFAPGFSTAESLTDISGRGVGMDVVRVNITKLGGTIKISSIVGKSTTIIMMLPLTLAVLEGLEVKIGKKEFILPVAAISETLQATPSIIRKIGDKGRELVSIRDELIPVIRVHRLLNIEPKKYALEDGILLVSNYEDKKAAIFVDEYGDQNQVAVKSLEKNFIKMGAFSSATVKSDGSIGLILDVGGLVELQKQMEKKGIL